MKLLVIVQRRGLEDREIECRVTDAELAREREARFGTLATDEEIRADIARQRAARRMYGRSVRWQSDTVPHRGQVWTPAETGGENAVTGMITMRVEAR